MRLIDANVLTKLIKEFRDDAPEKTVRWFTCNAILSMIGDEGQTPTIDPETLRPTGRWIEEEFEAMGVCMIRQKCSECGRYEWQKEKYCHCGCKMEG